MRMDTRCSECGSIFSVDPWSSKPNICNECINKENQHSDVIDVFVEPVKKNPSHRNRNTKVPPKADIKEKPSDHVNDALNGFWLKKPVAIIVSLSAIIFLFVSFELIPPKFADRIWVLGFTPFINLLTLLVVLFKVINTRKWIKALCPSFIQAFIRELNQKQLFQTITKKLERLPISIARGTVGFIFGMLALLSAQIPYLDMSIAIWRNSDLSRNYFTWMDMNLYGLAILFSLFPLIYMPLISRTFQMHTGTMIKTYSYLFIGYLSYKLVGILFSGISPQQDPYPFSYKAPYWLLVIPITFFWWYAFVKFYGLIRSELKPIITKIRNHTPYESDGMFRKSVGYLLKAIRRVAYTVDGHQLSHVTSNRLIIALLCILLCWVILPLVDFVLVSSYVEDFLLDWQQTHGTDFPTLLELGKPILTMLPIPVFWIVADVRNSIVAKKVSDGLKRKRHNNIHVYLVMCVIAFYGWNKIRLMDRDYYPTKKVHETQIAARMLKYTGLPEATPYRDVLDNIRNSAEIIKIPEAQFLYAKCFEVGGYGLPRSRDEALHWYRLSAEQGHVDSTLMVAIHHHDNSDTMVGINMLHELAEQGSPRAMHYLAICLWHWLNEPAVGFRWLQRSAEAGNVEAQTDLAKWYTRGIGVRPDLQEAEQWAGRALRNGAGSEAEEIMEMIKRRKEEW